MGNTSSSTSTTTQIGSEEHGSQEKPLQAEKNEEKGPVEVEMQKFPMSDSLPETGFGPSNRPCDPVEDKGGNSGFSASQKKFPWGLRPGNEGKFSILRLTQQSRVGPEPFRPAEIWNFARGELRLLLSFR